MKGKSLKEIKKSLNSGSVQVRKCDLPEDWSFDSADFINRLLQLRPENRLGYEGFYQIKEHTWLKNFPWEKVDKGKLDPVFQPKVLNNCSLC